MPKIFLLAIIILFLIFGLSVFHASFVGGFIEGKVTYNNIVNTHPPLPPQVVPAKTKICAELISSAIQKKAKRKYCTKTKRVTQVEETVSYSLHVPVGSYIVYTEKRREGLEYISRGYYTNSPECESGDTECLLTHHQLVPVRVYGGDEVYAGINPADWTIP